VRHMLLAPQKQRLAVRGTWAARWPNSRHSSAVVPSQRASGIMSAARSMVLSLLMVSFLGYQRLF
jgi:hypothetical protein